MVVCKEGKAQCLLTLDNVILQQVEQYKYLGSWITENARCEQDVRARIGMAKAAFWQNKEIMRRNIKFHTKKKLLNCYIFSILNYGCESWTWNKALCRNINAFEMWCYRRMLKISYKDKVTNKEVLNRAEVKLLFMNDMKKRKLIYGGHVLRGSSGESHLYILEGKVEGKKIRRRPRLTWMDDTKEWTGFKTYEKIKRTAEDRHRWKP